MTKTLRFSPDLELPLEAATQKAREILFPEGGP